MLILTRSKEEEIIIGDNISIKVVGIYRGPGNERVRLGIEAPDNIKIRRGEHIEKQESHNAVTNG
tara:strand:+ start:255 stop:449 length:195 start_codon:yes stop_codon:yes gene_type:complete